MSELTGRELDAAVAEKVMGWRWVQFLDDRTTFDIMPPNVGYRPEFMLRTDQLPNGKLRLRTNHCDLLRSSTDVSAAMQVLCKVRGNPPCDFLIGNNGSGDYFCEIIPSSNARTFLATGSTISEAICRAALKVTT